MTQKLESELHCPYCLSGYIQCCYIQGSEESVIVVRNNKRCNAGLKWCANCKQYFVVNVKF